MAKTSELDRRRFCGLAAVTAAGWSLDLLAHPRRILVMTDVMAEVAEETTATPDIRPFNVPKVSDADLTDLRRRITATRWPERETVNDASQGVQLATMQAL